MFTAIAAIAAAGMSVPATPAPAWSGHMLGHDYSQEVDNRRRNRRAERVNRNTRVWRGNDGRYYCRKSDGTTGLIIGGAVGALAGRAIDTRGDRTVGTLLGAAGGAVLGRELERSNSRCR